MKKYQKWLVAGGALVVVLGLFGSAWYVWSTQLRSADETGNQNQPMATDNKTEFKTLTVNGYTFKYPLNENNEQVIVRDIGNMTSPEIAYQPVRTYFAGNTNKDCADANAGLLQAGRLADLFGPSNTYGSATSLPDKQAKIDTLINSGKAVKVGDIYVLAPSKQNEPCEELANPKGGKLQIALFEAQEIEKTWLKSLKPLQ